MYRQFYLLAFLCVIFWSSPDSSRADVVWVDGRPVFRGASHLRNQRFEARRSYRRPRSNESVPRPVYPRYASGGPRPDITPKAPNIVTLPQKEKPGTIIIDQQNRRLFYVVSRRRGYIYPISVGRDGFRWTGTKKISAVKSWPRWTPPAEMRERQPWLPITMSGGVRNPLGAKALYLGASLYRIHGTNDPNSIGRASSSGCFRMMNAHVLHLATLAEVGTVVRVVKKYPDCAAPQCKRDRVALR